MKTKRICKKCGKTFIANRKNSFHCSRECFLSDYKNEKDNDEHSFPEWICPRCGKKHQLDFSPRLRVDLWLKFCCEKCNFNIFTDNKREMQ